MAKTPDELLRTLTFDQQKFLDDLEKQIDAEMVKSYQGGNFRFSLKVPLSVRELEELKRRYSHWTIHAGGVLGEDYSLEFRPIITKSEWFFTSPYLPPPLSRPYNPMG